MKTKENKNMAKNKAKQLGVSGFLKGVQSNQPVNNDKRKDGEDNYSSSLPNNDVHDDLVNREKITESVVSTIPNNAQEKIVTQEIVDVSNQESHKDTIDHKYESKDSANTTIKKVRGRPQRISDKVKRQVFKVDPEINTKLMIIKAVNNIDLQDVCYAVIANFLDTHFLDHASGLDSQALDLINKTLAKHNS